MSSRKVLATHSTADFIAGDCTESGYIFKLWADGRVSAVYHSRWSGDSNGMRWVTKPYEVCLLWLEEDGADAILARWVYGEDPKADPYGNDPTWRKTSNGHRVR